MTNTVLDWMSRHPWLTIFLALFAADTLVMLIRTAQGKYHP